MTNTYTVTITGRNVEIPTHFEERITDKLQRISKLDPTLTHFNVELHHEPNPRRESESDKVQITAIGSGHLARAEAKDENFYASLETALDKLERSLRKVKARRDIAKSGHRAPLGTGELAALLQKRAEDSKAEASEPADPYENEVEFYEPGQIVRSKVHGAEPMSAEDALGQMELVGHDFYLFVDADTSRPSVVYRRHGFDYGLIALDV